MTEHFIIVGAGICGARAAFGLRERGFDGRITLIGDEALAPYERPPLSKQTLIDEPEPRFVAPIADYIAAGIELLCGAGVDRIDRANRAVNLADGRSFAYDRLLLATGARPRPLPGMPPGSARALTLRNHGDVQAIKAHVAPGKRLVIVGGGFIGLELAATARKLGAEVILLEGLSRLLSRGVPMEIATLLEQHHRIHGVDIRLDAGIVSINDTGNAIDVRLADGEMLSADLLVAGIGALPNVALAEQTGLATDNGIVVDHLLTTSDPAIFAAGDCCSFPLLLYGGRRVRLEAWRNAQDQGIAAAASMMDAGVPYVAVPWFWSDQYDLTLQICGLAEGAETVIRRQVDDEAFILFHLDGAGRLIAASGIGRGNAVARDIRLAEMLVAGRAHPDPLLLASPDTKLKKLLAA